ncbi:MAG: DarT ssDNA thymidine ADP-ribosyltransferase family protein, partial [Bdellovibrionia bacterium]
MFLYQEIFNQYMLGPAYHLTHIHNLSLILDMGELNSHSRMRGRGYFDLSNEDVQAGRAAITVPVTNRPLHDYVPLYFGFKTPMVACNQ